MHVLVEMLPRGESRSIDLPDPANGLDLVKALGLMPDAHILAREHSPIPIDESLRNGETVQLIQVVSGG